MTRQGLRFLAIGIVGALALAASGGAGVQKAEAAFLPLGLENAVSTGPMDDTVLAAPSSYSSQRFEKAAAPQKKAGTSRSDKQDKALWTLLVTAAFVGGVALLDAWMRRRKTRGC